MGIMAWESRMISNLINDINTAGSDSLAVFGGTHEGGYHIQQDAGELAGLIDALQGRTINNYLQIGCAAGGTERLIVEKCGIKSLTVMDIGQHPKFPVFVNHNRPTLEAQGVDVVAYIGDSHADEADEFIASQSKHFELIGIDGDHSPAGVRMDWKLIEPCLKAGVLVWFHDINSGHLPIGQQGALEVWAKVKERHRVIYETMDKFGIGLVEIV